MSRWLLPSALLLASCGPAAHPLPERVHITLIEATVAPATEQGEPWDGAVAIPPELVQQVAQALMAAPVKGRIEAAAKVAAVGAMLSSVVMPAFVPPDPKGQVELLGVGQPRRLSLPERANTYRPVWSGVSFDQVPLHEGLRLRVQLFDADDLDADDPIGTAEIGYDEVVEALSSGQVTQIRVADQTRKQLLYVGISVVGR